MTLDLLSLAVGFVVGGVSLFSSALVFAVQDMKKNGASK